MTTNPRRRGRPSAAESAEIEARIWPYFEMGVSAEFTAKQNGMPSKGTCQKYFKIWTKERRKSYVSDLAERQKDAICCLCVKYDRSIYDLEAQKNRFTKLIIEDQEHQEFESRKLENEGKSVKPYRPNPYYEGMYKGLVRDIAELASAKTAVMIQATVDEEQNEAVLEKFLKKHRNLLGENK